MSDINQNYNIDTTQAIASLQSLDRNIAKLNTTISRLDNTSRSVKKLTVTWETLGRVVATQAIVRGLSQARQLFQEASESAEKFQITLARIQGISDVTDLGGLRSSLEEIARSSGRNINEVTGASLDAFQNDIGTVEETTKLLTGAIRDLAVATESDFGAAVNTISPLIKAYNLDASRAQEVSALLFQTIDSGVVQLDELEGSLGGVAKLAADLNVPIEEVFAAIATGTLAGNSTSTSLTQLRNVLIKLTKPTRELQAAFNELGVKNFTELQAQGLTLRESIDAIYDALDQDPGRFALAFNTIRATLGATNIRLQEGADNASVFDRVLNDISTSGDSLQNALALIENTDGFKNQQNAAEFSNILNTLGDDVLALKVGFGDLALSIFNDIDKIRVALVTGASLATAYGVAFTGLVSAAAVLPPVAVAGAAALATLFFLDGIEAFNQAVGETKDRLNDIGGARAGLEIIKKEEIEKLRTLKEELQDTDVAINKLVAGNQRAVQQFTRELVDSLENVEAFAVNSVESFADSRERLLGGIDSQIKSLDDTIADNLSNLSDAQRGLADFNFDRSLKGLSERQKLIELEKRAVREITEAREALSKVGISEESVAAAVAANDEAEAATRALSRQAEKLGIQQQINRALALEASVLSTNVEIFNQQKRALEGTNVTELRKGLVDLTKLNAGQQIDVEKIRELYSTTDAEGVRKSVQRLASDVEEARLRTEILQESFKDFAGADILEDLGLVDAVRSAQEALIDGFTNVDIDFTNAINKFEDQLTGKTYKVSVEFIGAARAAAAGSPLTQDAIDQAEALAGGDATQSVGPIRDNLNKLIEDQQRYRSTIRETAQEATISNKVLAQNLKQLRSFSVGLTDGMDGAAYGRPFEQFAEGAINSLDSIPREGLDRVINQFQTRIPKIAKLLEDGLISSGRAKLLESTYLEAINRIGTRIRELEAQALIDPQAIEAAESALDAASGLQNEVIEPKVDLSGLRDLKASIDAAKEEGVQASASVGSIGPSATNANTSVSSLSSTTGGLSGQANAAAQAFSNLEQAALAAAQAAAQANSSGNVEFAYRGGQIGYRAAGGPSRGQDTQPAMLAPGEFVVNEQSSRNFFSQLNAINASSGSGQSGSGTTINIGDVNVTPTSNIPGDTARDIGQSIKRELRRRTFAL